MKDETQYPNPPQGRKKKRRKRRRKTLIGKFFSILCSILLIYFVALGAYVGYTYLNDNDDDDYFTANKTIIPNFIAPKVPERTNFLLTGVDADETRTDSIMIGTFNSVTKQVSLISIPRDTLVEIPDDRFRVMKENTSNLKSNEMKINAVHAFSGKDKGMEYLELQIEDMLDIEIDYYAKVNCEAFRYIVDSIGGIDFNVEERLYYSDPTQDLYIDLKPGMQHLDGDKAEQLVRFRYGYARQDLHRVEVQQEFMKTFMATALNKDTILSNPTAYLNTIFKYVDTNLGITDAIKYIKYLSDFNSGNILSYTLPGEPQNIGDGSYYVMDEEAAEELVYEVFKKASTKTEDIVKEDSFGKEIQILNGGYISGLAGKKKDLLEADGYTVSDIGDYTGEKKEQTKIYVKKDGQGDDLQKYFTDSKIIADSSKTEEYDIVIVLGTNEREQSDTDE